MGVSAMKTPRQLLFRDTPQQGECSNAHKAENAYSGVVCSIEIDVLGIFILIGNNSKIALENAQII